MTATIYNFDDYKRAKMLRVFSDSYREHVHAFLNLQFDDLWWKPTSDCDAPNGQMRLFP
jgi:hypothetical protein